MNFLEKLDALMRRSGMNKSRLSQVSGVPYTTIDGLYKKGYENTKISTLRKIAAAFGVSLDYLVGDGEGPDGAGEGAAPSLSAQALEMAYHYDALTEHGKGAVDAILGYEFSAAAEQRPQAMPRAKHRRDGFVEIRVYDQPAAAGLGNYLDEPQHHMEQYPEELIPEKTDFGVVIAGDSMEPEIPDGATVFVQAVPVVESGQVGIFVLDGKAYCKRLVVDHDRRELRLVSANPAYAPIPITDQGEELRTMGRVLGHYAPRIWRG